MSKIKFYKTISLPDIPEPDSLYFVLNNNIVDTYLTSSTGEIRSTGNSEMINDIITDRLSDYNLIDIVNDISERNLLPRNKNFLVMVLDATDDETVNSGSALYAYIESSDTFTKVTEYESLDLVLSWDNLQNKPNSSVGEIDISVSLSHEHQNKSIIDNFSVDELGMLTYNGQPLSSTWTTNDW